MEKFFSPLVENALRLASYWHRGQLTSDGVFDYMTHPYAVGMILSRAGFEDEVVAAGICHKLLIETECPDVEIVEATTERVLYILEPLVRNTKYGRNRKWKADKSAFLQNVPNFKWEAKAVLVADRIHVLNGLMEALREGGFKVFDQFVYTPEDSLWFEDQLCMSIQEGWKHPLVDQYDELVNEYVDLLESLDKQSPAYIKEQQKKYETYDFERPVVESVQMIEDDEDDDEPSPPPEPQDVILEKLATIDEYIEKKKKKMLDLEKEEELDAVEEEELPDLFKHLEEKEAMTILPAVLKLAIQEGEVTSQMFQEKLAMNFMVSYRVLKELKRLHVIKKVDGVKPRKVDVDAAKELVKELKSRR